MMVEEEELGAPSSRALDLCRRRRRRRRRRRYCCRAGRVVWELGLWGMEAVWRARRWQQGQGRGHCDWSGPLMEEVAARADMARQRDEEQGEREDPPEITPSY